MNKNLCFLYPAFAIALSFVLVCCHGRLPGHDARLVAADSILRNNDPDSALRLLDAIDGAKLPSAGDRAYHALLLTQAQYRCYVDITSDSTINVALDYYKHHDEEREKLTRSYIYKGAVTEVMGDPENAMACYKQAVDVAGSSDHYNLGYAKMRIGSLYRDNLVMDSADITQLKQALYHFEQVPDSFYIAQCLSTIGNSYAAISRNDSALVYLEQADSLIRALNLTSMSIQNARYLADLKMFSHDIDDIMEAKDIAVSLCGKETSEQNHLLLIAAYTLAKLNKADSANYYLRQVKEDNLTDGLKVLYNDCYAELARCRGNLGQFEQYFRRADDISDSLQTDDMQRRLRDVESKYDNEILSNKSLRYRHNWMVSVLAGLLIAGTLLVVIATQRRRLRKRQRLVQESEEIIERLRSDSALLSSQLNAHQAMSDELKQAIRHQIEIFAQLVEKHAVQLANSPTKFSKAFAQFYRNSGPDGTFWAALRTYANSQYNNIIDESVAVNPELIDTDLNYLALYCCDLPTTVIMACLGYKDAHSVYNKRRRVSELLGYPNNLEAYVRLFKASCYGEAKSQTTII